MLSRFLRALTGALHRSFGLYVAQPWAESRIAQKTAAILPPRPGPARAIYEAAARQWHSAGRPTPITTPLDTAVALWWLGTPSVERLGVDPLVLEHLRAQSAYHERSNPQWMNRLLRVTTWCRYCGERWHLENVSQCTNCEGEFAPCCASEQLTTRWANGNHVCPRCTKGEIVG